MYFTKFNLWYLMIPAFMVVSFLFGTTKYRVTRRYRLIATSEKSETLMIVSTIFSALIQVMIMVESVHGVVQLISDFIPERDWGWLPFCMAVAMMASLAAFTAVFYYSGKLGEASMKALIKFLLRRRAKRLRELDRKFEIPEIDVH